MEEFRRRVAVAHKKRRQDMDVGIIFSNIVILFNAACAVIYLLYLEEKIYVGVIQGNVIPAADTFGRNTRSAVQIYV